MLRLLLALLLAFAASPMPAAASNHAMSAAAHSHDMHGKQHQAPMPVDHVCIGCVAVADWDGTRVAPPVASAPMPLAVSVAALPLLPGQAPTPAPSEERVKLTALRNPRRS